MIWATAAVTLLLVLGFVLSALALIREFSTHRDSSMLLLIVARTEKALYDYQARRFAGHRRVEVILDRRYGERRRQPGPVGVERRRGERRKRANVDAEITAFGSVILPLNSEPSASRQS